MLQKLKNLQKNLTNTYLCKKLRLSGQLVYPYSILPKTKYKLEINFDDLISDGIVYLLRRSDLPFGETFHTFNDGNKVLNDDAIDINRIPDLSLNLLGSYYKTIHSKYIPIKDGSKQWVGLKVYLSEYLNEYKVDNENGHIFINATELHNKTLPYDLKSNINLTLQINSRSKKLQLIYYKYLPIVPKMSLQCLLVLFFLLLHLLLFLLSLFVTSLISLLLFLLFPFFHE